MRTTALRLNPLLLLPLLAAQFGCSSTIRVEETASDRAFLDSTMAALGNDGFFVPAEVRFQGPLRTEDTISAPSSAMSGGDTFRMPVYEVVREACEIAVHSSFKQVNQPPKEFLRDQALEVEFKLREGFVKHQGGDGEATCTLDVICQVRYPPPSTMVVDSFQVRISEMGILDDDGTGQGNSAGVLWLAAAELAQQISARLREPSIRSRFSPRENFIAWRSSVDGHVPPGNKPKYDVRNTWGEYIPVVKLVDLGVR